MKFIGRAVQYSLARKLSQSSGRCNLQVGLYISGTGLLSRILAGFFSAADRLSTIRRRFCRNFSAAAFFRRIFGGSIFGGSRYPSAARNAIRTSSASCFLKYYSGYASEIRSSVIWTGELFQWPSAKGSDSDGLRMIRRPPVTNSCADILRNLKSGHGET